MRNTLTFPFKLVAVVGRCVYAIKVQLCAFVQLVREKRPFTVVECKTDVWGCKSLLCLLSMTHYIPLDEWQIIGGYTDRGKN